MSSVAEAVRQALGAGSALALPLAFLGGLAMGLNPCCFALYPTVAACCASRVADGSGVLRNAALFAGGTTAATTVLGLLAAFAGRAFTGLAGWLVYFIALVPVIAGLEVLGLIRIPLPVPMRTWAGRGSAGPFLTGLISFAVLGPCGTPVLAALLAFAAYRGAAFYGAVLLFAYGLGNSVPLVVAGGGAGWLFRRAERSWEGIVRPVSGVCLVGLGFYLLIRP